MQGTLAPFVISCLLVSCNNGVDGKIENMSEQVEIVKDPVSTEIVPQSLKSKIPEPFRIAEFNRLDFTSGGSPAQIRTEFCDSLTTGFFGNYYLIDKDFSDANGRPVGGIITVHVVGKMGSWKADDTTQTIWKIHLLSALEKPMMVSVSTKVTSLIHVTSIAFLPISSLKMTS